MSAIKDITGQRFGRLVALNHTNRRSGCSVEWECLCDCGQKTIASGLHLMRSVTKSCGCLFIESVSKNGTRLGKDITGQRFGRLVALNPTALRILGSIVWECKCDCGQMVIAASRSLKDGSNKSCGCLVYAGYFVKNTNIDPFDVPFEVTDCIKARCELKKQLA